MTPEAAAAVELARHGLAVVPLHRRLETGACSCMRGASCPTPGKHPRIRWRERPALPPTPEELERWWRAWSDSLVGVILGDHHCAIDVDEHGDEHGLDELHDLEATFGALPDTWRALTPTGGLHVWFALAGELAATTYVLRAGVQLRAGRHVMACPPSTGREWEVAPGEAPLAALPAWVPQYLRERNLGGATGYLPIPDRLGAGWRHDTYVAAARSMARIALPGEAIFAALKVTDRLRGDPPKDDDEELRAIAVWASAAQAAEDAEDERFAREVFGGNAS
jgi:hypothetical protein